MRDSPPMARTDPQKTTDHVPVDMPPEAVRYDV
jgi:hypothetical protein